jgi:hypothetical protein
MPPELEKLLRPSRLLSRAEFLSDPCPVPRTQGIYAWYFDEVPSLIDATGCHTFEGYTLLYVGIGPSKKAKDDSRNLHARLKEHFALNAEGSTLRLTLGCLLSEQLGIQLQRVGPKRLTFTNLGEQKLDAWMDTHARVAWAPVASPWLIETEILASDLPLPFNIEGRGGRKSWLSRFRQEHKRIGRSLPIISDQGGLRRSGTATATAQGPDCGLEALRADLARTVEASSDERLEPPSGTV